MHYSRRHLFRLGQACLAAAAMPGKIFAGEPDTRPFLSDPLLKMTRDSFTPLLRSSFVANASSLKPTWLTLTAVEDGANLNPGATASAASVKGPGVPQMDTFALEFQGVGAPLTQGVYSLQRQTLGKITLLLVPSGAASYTAIINHLVGPLPSNYRIPAGRTGLAGAAAAARIRVPTPLQNPAV